MASLVIKCDQTAHSVCLSMRRQKARGRLKSHPCAAPGVAETEDAGLCVFCGLALAQHHQRISTCRDCVVTLAHDAPVLAPMKESEFFEPAVIRAAAEDFPSPS